MRGREHPIDSLLRVLREGRHTHPGDQDYGAQVHERINGINIPGEMRAAILILLGLSRIATAAQNTSTAANAHIGKGYELEQDERFAEAAAEFRAALALDPGAVNAHYQLAVCLFAIGDRDASRHE